VRANVPGLQLALRIEFPRSRDVATGRVLSTLVLGPRYAETGTWHTLSIDQVPLLAERNARMLRTNPGQQVDVREAVVTHVVLLAPGQRAPSTIDVAQLKLTGTAHTLGLGDNQLAGGPLLGSPATVADVARQPPIAVAIESQTLMAGGRPVMPRLVSYHGESLELIKQLGFNGIWLDTPPTPAMARSADQLGLWIVGPAPEDLADIQADSSWRCVLCWTCGARLLPTQRDITRAACDDIRAADQQLCRPLAASIAGDSSGYRSLVDVIASATWGQLPSSTPSDVARLIKSARHQAGSGCVLLGEVELDLPSGLRNQLTALDAETPPWIEPAIVRDQALRALAEGAKGIVYRTAHPLSGEDTRSQRLRAHLFELNHQISLAEPWLVRGGSPTRLADSTGLSTIYMWQLDRTRLLLPLPDERWPRGDGVSTQNLAFIAPGVPITVGGFRMAGDDLRSIDIVRKPGGAEIALDPRWQHELLVLTDDARAAADLRRRLRSQALANAKAARDRLRIDVETLAGRHTAIPAHRQSAATTDLLPLAKGLLTQVDLSLAARDTRRAIDLLDELNLRIDQAYCIMRRQVAAVGRLESLPTAVAPATWAQHAKLRDVVDQVPRGNNRLPGGNFENVSDLQNAGWRHTQRADSRQASAVTLTSDSPHTGAAALRLATRPREPGGDDGPAVWIVSPPVAVTSGQLVEITGWVRVSPNQGDEATLEIFDSIGTADLALAVRGGGQWTSFRLLRAATSSEPLSLTLALAGSGVADVDAVMIRPLERPQTTARGTTAVGR
jgi:hypothetical protein